MKIIVCLDDGGGMTFNKRRQSRDRILLADIKAMTEGETLFASPFSEKLLKRSYMAGGSSPGVRRRVLS